MCINTCTVAIGQAAATAHTITASLITGTNYATSAAIVLIIRMDINAGITALSQTAAATYTICTGLIAWAFDTASAAIICII